MKLLIKLNNLLHSALLLLNEVYCINKKNRSVLPSVKYSFKTLRSVVFYKSIWWKYILSACVCLYTSNVFAQPVADFSATPVSGCAPLLVNFTDLSAGSPTSWKWDLGNGTISVFQNPSVTYFATGKYKVILIVTNASGSDTLVKDQYINVEVNPAVAFTGNPLTGCLPLPVQFTDQSAAGSGNISSWKWDFGDGVIGTTQNPQHVYTSAGTFDVTLQVKNNFGCTGTLSKTKYINTTNSVKANFTNNVQSNCKPPVSLTFQNLSTGPPAINYQWDFGDGVTSMQTNPSHTFTTAGNFNVKLIADANGCSDTVTKIISIGTVLADFSAPLTVCPGKSFSLTNTSTPAPISVFWDFGDGTTSDSINPVKTYTTQGNYNIKLIVNFGACVDSVFKKITVLGKQTLAFTADNTAGCKAPFTVNFSNTSLGVTGYSWDFGDGTTSSLANPSHTYNTTGNYTITFIGTNSSGCQDTLIKINYIRVQAASVSLPELPVKDCVPFMHTFSAAINSPDAVQRYTWNFGDGTTDTVANPTHTYTAVGSYTISLKITTVSGCVASVTVPNGVIAGIKPKANFSATPLVACASESINFTDLSTGNVNEWLWDFGDSATSTEQNPAHRYGDTGYFRVLLTVRSSGCPDSISFAKYIYIKPAIAKFKIRGNCALPFQKIFTDNSEGASTWLWNFGDGATSSTKNPTHVYADTGTYPVILRVTNTSTGCTDTISRIAQVILEKANFAASNTNVCKNSTVTFKPQNINVYKISSYNWDFGDSSATTTSVDSVNHIYTQNGTFNVRLIITDLIGCKDTLVKPMYIIVNGPTAKFTTNLPGTCVNNAIDFIDSSFSDGTHPIVQWTWDFGDNTGATFVAPPFTHVYNKAGIYTIKLKVTDSNGCTDSLIKINYIMITQPVADFISTDTASCPLAAVHFVNLATGPNLQYFWNFGDGTTSNDPNPIHQYATTNIFTVSLKITDAYGCSDSIQKINYITITTPKANFVLSDSLSTCPPFFVTFNNTSTNYTTLSWDFGDGNFSSSVNPTHFYYIPGNYIVKLRTTGPGGCSDEKFSTIIVKGPNGVFSYTNIIGCDSVRTNFKASSKNNLSFIWDFSDGTTIKTTDSSISHTYTNSGFYLPKVILQDSSGCQVPITGTDTIKVLTVQSNFAAATNTLCDAGNVTFNDSSISNDVLTNWKWNFGDGTTSLQQNPTHYYTAPGLYTVNLAVSTTNGCMDTITKIGYIKVAARPDIDITGSTAGCELSMFTFNGIFLQPDTSIVTWKWDFGNGQIASLQIPPSQTYSPAGNYIVSAIATNSSGCMDTASRAITINPLPDINAGKDAFLCLGTPVQLQASGANAYQWLSPTNFLSCINCSNPVTTTPDDITYVVKGTNNFGCTAVDSINLRVKKPFTITVTPQADSICSGQSVQLNSSYAENYLWAPAAGLNNSFIQNPIASPATNTLYKLLAFDSAKCFKDSAYVNISVFKYPVVNAGQDKTIKIGTSITLAPTYSNDVTNWLWTPAAGLSCTNCPAPVAMPFVNTTYTLIVQNKGGCSAEDQVTIFMICNNENIFIPNTFSPNGDGVNDIFFPRGTGLNRIRGMKIFNRWGELVFEKSNFYANDPSSGWNGLVGGKKVPPDVYTFVIDVICDNGQVVSQNGNVTLLK